MSRTISAFCSRGANLALWAGMLSLNAAAQIAMKLSAGTLAGYAFGAGWIAAALASPWVWAAVACEAVNFALWLAILKRHTLAAAFPVSSLSYAIILAASWAFLHEKLLPLQIAGTALILLGVALMGRAEADITPV